LVLSRIHPAPVFAFSTLPAFSQFSGPVPTARHGLEPIEALSHCLEPVPGGAYRAIPHNSDVRCYACGDLVREMPARFETLGVKPWILNVNVNTL
jgi:hypothetical protein